MSATPALSIANGVDDGWDLDGPVAGPVSTTSTVDDGWGLDDEPAGAAPEVVLTLVADAPDEYPGRLDIDDGFALAFSDDEAAFFAAGDVLHAQKLDRFDDLAEPTPSFWQRLFRRRR
jgi:hypothetical protein